ncbi:phage protein [Enterobacter asburiae]|uniref:phage protein n=1 Tax=Enterobacter asburiae TaxID=61645 RepID=UPI004032D2AF
MATYSFMDVTASLSGPTGEIDLGYGSASSEEGITVAMGGPKNTMTIGADGEVMHSLHADKSGTVFLLSPALTCWRSTPIWASALSWWWSVTIVHRIIRRKPTWAAAVIYWYQRSKHVTELDETFRAAARGRERAGY